MKLNLVLLVLYISLLFSCSKKSNQIYSCNPSLNKWITANKESFENISRNELAKISSVDTQRAIYNSLPSPGKYRIWVEKLTLAKSSLSAEEQNHLQAAIIHLSPSDWESSETKKTLNIWITEWENNGVRKFGWDSTKRFLIAETWLTESELLTFMTRYDAARTNAERNAIANTAAPYPGTGGYTDDCTCRSSLACKWFTSTCEDGGCNRIQDCGLIGTSNCEGLCVARGSLNVVDSANNTRDTIRHN